MPACAQTRPYPDRVRQAVFDALGSRFTGVPGTLPPIAVLDLYAGSGVMGLEALSRGAAHCTFVEADARAARQLRANVESLDAADRTNIVAGDAERAVLAVPPCGTIGLVFIDPPYAIAAAAGRRGSVPALMARLESLPAISREATLILRHPVEVRYDGGMLAGFTVTDSRRFGGMSVTWLRIAAEPRDVATRAEE